MAVDRPMSMMHMPGEFADPPELGKDKIGGTFLRCLAGFRSPSAPPVWRASEGLGAGGLRKPKRALCCTAIQQEVARRQGSPLPGSPPHDRLVSRGIFSSLKESLRRSLPAT